MKELQKILLSNRPVRSKRKRGMYNKDSDSKMIVSTASLTGKTKLQQNKATKIVKSPAAIATPLPETTKITDTTNHLPSLVTNTSTCTSNLSAVTSSSFPVYIVTKSDKVENDCSVNGEKVIENLNSRLDDTCNEKSLGDKNSKLKASPKKSKFIKPVEPYPDPNTNVNIPVNCFICKKLFNTFADMQHHYLNNHKSKRRSNVDKSSSSETSTTSTQTTTTAALNSSKSENSTNPEEKKLSKVEPKCNVCSISFRTKAEVKKHMIEVHSYTCSDCKSTFYHLFDFTYHKCKKQTKKGKAASKRAQKNNRTQIKDLKKDSPSTSNISSNQFSKFVHIQPKLITLPTTSLTPSVPLFLNITTPKYSQMQNLSTIPFIYPKNQCIDKLDASSQIKDISQNGDLQPIVYDKDISNDNNANKKPLISVSKTLMEPTHTELSQTDVVVDNKVLTIDDKASHEINSAQLSRKELNRQKMNEIMNNPNISVTLIPSGKSSDVITEYTCGRCNVLCDDSEDFIDHIQDCLNFTNVSLEPVNSPPQRFLKLKNENTSFQYREWNSSECSINKNLIDKLKTALQRDYPLNSNDNNNNLTYSNKSSLNIKKITPKKNGHSFRDLLDDDSTGNLPLKMEPTDSYSDRLVDKVKEKLMLSGSSQFHANDKVVKTKTTLKAVNEKSLKKPLQPMVMIPMPQPNTENASDQFDSQENLSSITNKESPIQNCQSPLGVLLDEDEIKMEVEEEVVDDYYW